MVKSFLWGKKGVQDQKECILVRKMPPILGGLSKPAYLRQNDQREAFKRVCVRGMRDMNCILKLDGFLARKLQHRAKTAGGDVVELASMSKLNPAWVAAYLKKVYGSKVREVDLEAAQAANSCVAQQLLQHVAVLPPGLKLKPELMDLNVFAKFLDVRIEDVGDRSAVFQHVKEMVTKKADTIDWSPSGGGVYLLSFDGGGNAIQCRHRPSKAVAKIDKNVTAITRQFVMENNWSDFQAVVKCKPASVFLHTLFKKDHGPNALPLFTSTSKGYADAAEQAAKDITDSRDALSALASPSATSPAQEANFMQETRQAHKNTTAAKAKVQLKALQNKRASLKQVSLTAGAAGPQTTKD